MALHYSTKAAKYTIRQLVNEGYEPFHVGKVDGFIPLRRFDQKTGPRAAGSEVTNQKDVIREGSQGSAGWIGPNAVDATAVMYLLS